MWFKHITSDVVDFLAEINIAQWIIGKKHNIRFVLAMLQANLLLQPTQLPTPVPQVVYESSQQPPERAR